MKINQLIHPAAVAESALSTKSTQVELSEIAPIIGAIAGVAGRALIGGAGAALGNIADKTATAPEVEEARAPEEDYGDEYQDMVARVKHLAGSGPLKTVWDPAKRVYRNVPVATQPSQPPLKK
jgi:hypothetical protein